MKNDIDKYFEEVSENFLQLKNQSEKIEKAIEVVINSIKSGNTIIFCGNGGSAADSQHLAAELMGRYKIDRDPLSSIAITVDTSALTAIGKNYFSSYFFT